MAEKALSGVKVLELCELVAGPYCAKLIGDMGAEVIKLESPDGGDNARKLGPYLGDVPHLERSGLFLYLNTNKKGVTLNLASELGRRIFRDLVKGVDILVEDRKPGELAILGLGFEQLQRINRGLIMVSITPFGQTGPYRNYKAYDLNLYHAGGDSYFMVTGDMCKDLPPVASANWLGDYHSGIGAAVVTMAALLWRGVSGKGQHIDVSKQEWLLNLLRLNHTSWVNEGILQDKEKMKRQHAGLATCKNGYVLIYLVEDHHWERLVEIMDRPAWIQDERFQTADNRQEYTLEVMELLSNWCCQYTKEEVYHLLQRQGVPAGMVATTKEVLESPQMKARGFFVEIEHPETGRFLYPSAPYKFSETPWEVEHPAPRLGEHNEEVYCQRLGFSRGELAKFREMGAI